MGYAPKTALEERLFPNLGRARVTHSPYIPFIGREGTVIAKYEPARAGDRVIRLAFDEFWDRPDGIPPEKAQDNTYCFDGEYELIHMVEVENDQDRL
jgi:hypothetical protein